MSVKESRASKESSASTALALMAAARALKAWSGMGQHVQVSMSTLCMCKVYVPQSCQDSSAKMTLHDVKPEHCVEQTMSYFPEVTVQRKTKT